MIPKSVEEFIEKLRDDPNFRNVIGDVVDATAYRLLTHPDSPVKHLIEAAETIVVRDKKRAYGRTGSECLDDYTNALIKALVALEVPND